MPNFGKNSFRFSSRRTLQNKVLKEKYPVPDYLYRVFSDMISFVDMEIPADDTETINLLYLFFQEYYLETIKKRLPNKQVVMTYMRLCEDVAQKKRKSSEAYEFLESHIPNLEQLQEQAVQSFRNGEYKRYELLPDGTVKRKRLFGR
jgi:hypothetical protein